MFYKFKIRKGFSSLVLAIISASLISAIGFTVIKLHNDFLNLTHSLQVSYQANLFGFDECKLISVMDYDEVKNQPPTLYVRDLFAFYKEIKVKEVTGSKYDRKDVKVLIYKPDYQENTNQGTIIDHKQSPTAYYDITIYKKR